MNEFAMRRQWGPTPKYERVLNYQRPNQDFIVIAGPCSVESEEQIHDIAKRVAACGATHLRGGVFRAGTYPGANFGLVDQSLIRAYRDAARESGLKNIIEVLDYTEHRLDKVFDYASCFQIGARQMQNYTLLREVGSLGKPVFLKRNPGATIDEWLGAAEHVLAAGCKDLTLIERGGVTSSGHVRWDLSISMIPAIAEISRIPVVVDGSHGTGRRDLVERMTLAGVAAGAAGLLAEVHTNPTESLSDADQAIDPIQFARMMRAVRRVRHVIEEEGVI